MAYRDDLRAYPVGTRFRLVPSRDGRTGETEAEVVRVGRKYLTVRTPRGREFQLSPYDLGGIIA